MADMPRPRRAALNTAELDRLRGQKFESGSLQRRVTCELGSLGARSRSDRGADASYCPKAGRRPLPFIAARDAMKIDGVRRIEIPPRRGSHGADQTLDDGLSDKPGCDLQKLEFLRRCRPRPVIKTAARNPEQRALPGVRTPRFRIVPSVHESGRDGVRRGCRPLISPFSNEALLPERAGCRDRFGAG
jgi:hypothetical protein